MTYCVGVLLDAGLILASDTRTNAGVDSIATFRKMTIFEEPGAYMITVLTAGNLAITQAAISQIEEWAVSDKEDHNITKAENMFRVARIVGAALRAVHDQDAEHLKKNGAEFVASMIVGGQIKGERPRLFNVYAAGNFIEATRETPFFQIGETKYGKPVFDRLLDMRMKIEDAAKLVLISFDSTMRSNLSVGLPMDLLCYQRDSLNADLSRRLYDGDPYLTDIRKQWGDGLRKVFESLPPPAL